MKKRINAIVTSTLLLVTAQWAAADTSFTFQGELKQNGNLANGAFNMDFSLWDADIAGSQIGASIPLVGVPVEDGKFTVQLDYGADAFDNADRWLRIVVDGTALAPRTPITRAPYAIQTRGIFSSDDGFVGVGRQDQVSLAEFFGVHAPVNVGYGGMYISTDGGDGWPFYGYSAGGTFDMWTYYNGTTGDWHVNNAGLNRLTVAEDGYVGVGRSTPITLNSTFDVQSPVGDDNYGGMYLSTNSETAWPFYGYAAGGTADCWTYYDGGTEDWIVNNDGNRLTVESNGQVGIGLTSPGYLLHVNGSAGKPGGGSWTNSSDRRLKKDIQDMDGALLSLLRLRGVTFQYIDPDTINELPGQRIGVIAQEVEEVFPDWVDEREDGFKSVTFRGFEALTIEAFRELRSEKDTQIAQLNSRQAVVISDLRAEHDAELSDLKQRLAELEEVVAQLTQPREH